MGEKEEKGPVPLLLAECRHWRWNLRRMRRGGDEITGRFYLTTQGKISLAPRLCFFVNLVNLPRTHTPHGAKRSSL